MNNNSLALKRKIVEFIDSNPDIDCINLSLLDAVTRTDSFLVGTAISAGADIFMVIEGGECLIDVVMNYVRDEDIIRLFMEAVLEDAFEHNDFDNILFAIRNGAGRDIDEMVVDTAVELFGDNNEIIEVLKD